MGTVLALLLPMAPGTGAPDQPAGQLVQEVAAAGTPHVLNGEVYSVVQVGTTMVLGGTFSSARNDNSQTSLPRSRLLAFNANTGQISTTFLPNPNGTIRVVIPAGDGETVYVGGQFSSIGGVARDSLARIRISDGSVVTQFNAGDIAGSIRDLRLSEGRLWLAGAFTHVNGRAQAGITAINPTTGANLTYMSQQIAGVHNGGVLQPLKIDISPDGDRLVAVGNFDTVGGVQRHQFLMLDISGATAQVANFRTTFYHSACSGSFDSYMRDIDFSPDGSFFVVSTTGAYGGSEAACDTAARFETNQTGNDIRPSWVDYTGGDTSYAVEITDSVVYIGGHQRWWNNPFRGDAAGQGAVSREGIAALDPLNGLPLSWDPTRTKGVGVFDFLNTPQGLWVASDTDRIGNFQLKSRIARMLPGGTSFPAVKTTLLPNDVYTASTAGALSRRRYDATVGAPQSPANGGIAWGNVRGAFMINGQLYLANSDGSFNRRTFNGTTYGAPIAVDTADEIVPLTDWRADIQNATGMFFDGGRIYFTRSGSNQLFYRYFSPESDVVGAKRFVASNNVSGIDFAQVRGMFITNTHLYWAQPDGNLRRISWQQTPQNGVPVAGTASVVSGPGTDGVDWSGARAHWLFQNPTGGGAVAVNQPPDANFTVSCNQLTCSFNGTSSTDDQGVTSYTWDFGDGNGDTGAQVQHTYGSAGTRNVSLTVTDGGGLNNTETKPVSPSLAGVAFIGANSGNANSTTHRVTVPAGTQAGDALVLFLTSNTTGTTVANPAGWTTLENLDGNGVRGRVWTRTATAGDAGSQITVTTSGTTKAAISIAAYRATGAPGGAVVQAHSGVLHETSSTTFVSPSTTQSDSAGWVVSYWASKASVPVNWTAPAGQATRSTSAGSGGGAIVSLLTDGGGPGTPGQAGGLVALTDVAVTRVVSVTLVVGPG